MSRLAEALLTGAYNQEQGRNMLDLTYGGQNGWSPNLAQLVSNQAYVSKPVSCILLEAPKMFTVLPNSDKYISSLKALFELHAQSIDGLAAGLKVDVDEHAVGGAGEMQEEPVNVTRERSVPKFTFIEKVGRPIQTLLDYWIRYGIMSPETKFALLGTLGNSNVKDLLLDWYGATCLFFVPDPLHSRIDKAWITTNMFPKSNGDITAKRDLTTSQEMLTLDVEFTGISQYGAGVNQFAQNILNNINIMNADPNNMAAFINSVSPDVAAANLTGYKSSAEVVGRTAVTRVGG